MTTSLTRVVMVSVITFPNISVTFTVMGKFNWVEGLPTKKLSLTLDIETDWGAVIIMDWMGYGVFLA